MLSSSTVLVTLALLLHASTGLLALSSSAHSRLDLSLGPGRALHRLGKLPSVGHGAGWGRRVSSLRGGAGEDLVIGIDGGTESIRASVFRADGWAPFLHTPFIFEKGKNFPVLLHSHVLRPHLSAHNCEPTG